MDFLKKAYCRVFQTAFKVAIPILPYTSPAILHNTKAVAPLLKDKGINRILIVTDKNIHGAGLIEPLREALVKYGIEYFVFDETVPNPTVGNAMKAYKMYIENSCRAIIGFGGGSSMDCAKIVAAKVARPKKEIAKMEGILKVHAKLPFLIAVPTTAGTGSEVTVTTVMTDETNHHKFPISDFCLIPKVAVLDREITVGLSKQLTATTGMDALTHAIEAYIGRSTVKSTRKDSVEAVKLICDNLENAYKDGSDLKARENMLWGSFLAGRAFSKSYVGYCHAVAHSLGGKYNTPHGLANAVLLPYTLEMYGKSVYNKLKKLAIEIGIADKNTDAETAAKAFVEKIRTMNERLGIPKCLPEVEKKDIPKLSVYADKEANPLYPVPKLMDANELQKLYYCVVEEK